MFRAAAAAGVQRFVYASSVAAYGFAADIPDRIDEDWPTRPAHRLFYAQEKAELEALLDAEAAPHPELALYLLRPPIVLGPHAVGGKDVLPGPLAPLGRRLLGRPRRLPFPLPVFAPAHPMQFVHEEDVGRALLLCVVAAGPAGRLQHRRRRRRHDGDVAREFGALPIPFPGRAGPGGGARGRAAAVPAAGRRMGRGREPAGDHGHQPGPRPARVAAAVTAASRRSATPCARPGEPPS